MIYQISATFDQIIRRITQKLSKKETKSLYKIKVYTYVLRYGTQKYYIQTDTQMVQWYARLPCTYKGSIYTIISKYGF